MSADINSSIQKFIPDNDSDNFISSNISSSQNEKIIQSNSMNQAIAKQKRSILFSNKEMHLLSKNQLEDSSLPLEDFSMELSNQKTQNHHDSRIYKENSVLTNPKNKAKYSIENESYKILEKQFNQLESSSNMHLHSQYNKLQPQSTKDKHLQKEQSYTQSSNSNNSSDSNSQEEEDEYSQNNGQDNSNHPSYLTNGVVSIVTRKSIHTRKSFKRDRSRSPIKQVTQQLKETNFSCIRLNTKFDNGNWSFTQFITILVFVQRFIKALSSKIKSFKEIVKINEKVFTVLNDITFNRQYYVNEVLNKYHMEAQSLQHIFTSKLCYVCRCIGQLWYRVPNIQPNQTFKILSDCWQSFWIIYRMFYTTVKISFFIENMKESVGLIDRHILLLINASFIIDILLQFHTGYYERGIIVFDKRKIAQRYIKETLLSDILAQIPLFFQYTIDDQSTQVYLLIGFILEFFIFLKLFSLRQTFNRLERVITENEKAAQFFPLFTLSVQVLLLAHIVGLFYHGVAIYQIQFYDEDKTWLHATKLINESWLIKYIHTFYWAICTMVTILLYMPETNIETIFAIFSILLMCGVFGYALNTIGIIVTDMNKKQKEYKNQRQMLNRFFKKRQIPPSLRERIALYLEFKYKNDMERNQEEEDRIINQLSKQLQKQVKKEINNNNLQKFKILLDQFSIETKIETLQIIIEENYSQGELISANVSGSLYVIQQGSASMQTQKDRHSKIVKIKKLEKDDIFGLSTFFTSQQQDYVVKSLENTVVLRIDMNEFLMILQNNPDDLEKYYMLKDEILAKSTTKDLQCFCEICEQEGHFFEECQYLHYVVNKKKMIYNYNNLDTQIRQQFERSIARPINARANMDYSRNVVDDLFSESNENQDLQDVALFWQEFYIENIPEQDFDTNSEVEMAIMRQKSIQSRKKPSIKIDDQTTLNYSRCDRVEEEDSYQQTSESESSSYNIFESRGTKKHKSQKIRSKNKFNQKKSFNNTSSNIVINEIESPSSGYNNGNYKSFLEYDTIQYQQQESNVPNTPLNYPGSSTPGLHAQHSKGIIKNSGNLFSGVSQQLSSLDPFNHSTRPRVKSNASFMSIPRRTDTQDNTTSAFQDDKERKSRTARRGGTLMSMNTMNTHYLDQRTMFQHANTMMTHAKEKQQLQQKQKARVKDTWDLINFDKPKNYKVYFPWNNLENLVEQAVIHSENQTQNSDQDLKYKDLLSRHIAKRKSFIPQSINNTYFSKTQIKHNTVISPTKSPPQNRKDSMKQFISQQESDKNLMNMANQGKTSLLSLQGSSLQNLNMENSKINSNSYQNNNVNNLNSLKI